MATAPLLERVVHKRADVLRELTTADQAHSGSDVRAPTCRSSAGRPTTSSERFRAPWRHVRRSTVASVGAVSDPGGDRDEHRWNAGLNPSVEGDQFLFVAAVNLAVRTYRKARAKLSRSPPEE